MISNKLIDWICKQNHDFFPSDASYVKILVLLRNLQMKLNSLITWILYSSISRYVSMGRKQNLFTNSSKQVKLDFWGIG